MPEPEIHAQFRLLTTVEGGRKTPFVAGYRPEFKIEGENECWIIAIVDCSPNPFPPGAVGTIQISFLSWDKVKDRLAIGTRFEIREGWHVIGYGEIYRQDCPPHTPKSA